MPTQAEMIEVTKLIEARLDSRYMRDDGVVEIDGYRTWRGYEEVIESIDGKLSWDDLTESERQTILQSKVTWKGFTPEQELDVIGTVLSGDPPEEWMDGVPPDRKTYHEMIAGAGLHERQSLEGMESQFNSVAEAEGHEAAIRWLKEAREDLAPEREIDAYYDWFEEQDFQEELISKAAEKIEWVKSMSFIIEEGRVPEPCSDCFMPWWENLSQEEQKAALLEHVDWSGIEAVRDEMIAAAVKQPDLEREAEESLAMRELEEMFRADPPDFTGWESAEGGAYSADEWDSKALAEEIREDEHAARVRDHGEADAETYEHRMDEAYRLRESGSGRLPSGPEPVGPEEMERVVAEVEASWLEAAGPGGQPEAPRGWEFAGTSVDDMADYERLLGRAATRAANDNERGLDR